MMLKTIHETLQSKTTQFSGYCKMTAILDRQKDYSEITLEEGLEIEEFLFDYLEGIGAHLSKAYESTSGHPHGFMEMEWNISTAAVDSLCSEATKHKSEFIRASFLFLKIGDFTVINKLPLEVSCVYVRVEHCRECFMGNKA